MGGCFEYEQGGSGAVLNEGQLMARSGGRLGALLVYRLAGLMVRSVVVSTLTPH